jgi:hypothetical protein
MLNNNEISYLHKVLKANGFLFIYVSKKELIDYLADIKQMKYDDDINILNKYNSLKSELDRFVFLTWILINDVCSRVSESTSSSNVCNLMQIIVLTEFFNLKNKIIFLTNIPKKEKETIYKFVSIMKKIKKSIKTYEYIESKKSPYLEMSNIVFNFN